MAMQEIDSMVSANFELVNDHDEDTSLPGRTRHWLAARYGTTRKCVSAKAALLILLWSFVLGLLSGFTLYPDVYLRNFNSGTAIIYLLPYGGVSIINCFFPLAGILADIKYGRYKTVVLSIYVVLLAFMLVTGIAAVITLGAFFLKPLAIVFGVLGGIVAIMLLVGLIGFTANVVQFGMDQLHDSPGEDSTLFIHWYVWTYYASLLIVQLTMAFCLGLSFFETSLYSIIGYCLLAPIPVVIVMVLAITLSLVRHRRRWFLIEPGTLNPYKLVYRVTKFARKHKIPVQRSAFTYCEDELPSGLDLGKEKYGGFFTTEQVEDVKAFYGILKVLFSFGIVFFLDFAADIYLPFFASHIMQWPSNGFFKDISYAMLKNGLLSPLLIVICIPLYLCFLRPFISQYIPGMLKRMGLGIFFVLLSLIASFSMDLAVHLEDEHNNTCMFHANYYYDHSSHLAHLNPALLLIQLTLSALSHMLIYTAVFEFICSQSPHSMKGMLIGLLYAIRGLYLLLATIFALPFYIVNSFYMIHHSSYEFYYYLTNIVIGVVALLVYTCVAKRYRYRVRDEPCNVYQYAENYYSNQQYREQVASDI